MMSLHKEMFFCSFALYDVPFSVVHVGECAVNFGHYGPEFNDNTSFFTCEI